MPQPIIIAIPVFIALMGVEYVYGILTRRNNYRLNDTISSLSQGVLSQAVAACTTFFQIGAFSLIYRHVPNWGNRDFWPTWYGAGLAIVLYDFCNYWLHRIDHRCNFYWASHVIHHQSQQFNLSTALRHESASPVIDSVFFFPLALMGMPPEVFGTAAFVVLVYQVWVHTEHIGKLGWFDYVFTSPSNHRVHHSINEKYLNKNYAAVLIIWDRMFGTFEPESEPCIYGTLTPLNSWNPFKALSAVFLEMAGNMARAKSWADKIRFLYKPPGWMPSNRPAAADSNMSSPMNQAKYDPPVSRGRRIAAAVFFMLAGAVMFMLAWHEGDISSTDKWLTVLLITGMLWGAGVMIEPNNTPTQPQGKEMPFIQHHEA